MARGQGQGQGQGQGSGPGSESGLRVGARVRVRVRSPCPPERHRLDGRSRPESARPEAPELPSRDSAFEEDDQRRPGVTQHRQVGHLGVRLTAAPRVVASV